MARMARKCKGCLGRFPRFAGKPEQAAALAPFQRGRDERISLVSLGWDCKFGALPEAAAPTPDCVGGRSLPVKLRGGNEAGVHSCN